MPQQSIFEAWSDEEWVSDGAAVRVSIVCFGVPSSGVRRLDGRPVQAIHADLTGAGLDLTRARPLAENKRIAFNSVQKTGPFEISGEHARSLLRAPLNPNGRPNSDVVRPWWNGLDVVRRPRDFWIIDFGSERQEAEAALYDGPFDYIYRMVKPIRDANTLEALRRVWWRLWRPRREMREAISCLSRFIASPEVAKHRIFVFVSPAVLPDKNLIAVARDDDTAFGILHSRFHEAWSLRLGTSLEDRPRYTPTTTFETFPFPRGLTLDRPPADYADDPHAQAIAHAARRLNELRNTWLNPPDLVRCESEIIPGFPDRLLPVDKAAAKLLAKRTLTTLYNDRPRWLADAHDALDSAVAAAYGWPAGISTDAALAHLLDLNLTRVSAQPGS